MFQIEELLGRLPASEQEKFLAQMTQYKDALQREKCQSSFLDYVKYMWPGFVHGRHHAVMAKKFEEVVDGDCKRLIINMAPRHTKSEFASYLLPSWFLGKYPDKKVIQSSNTADLAVGFGRKVRNLVGSDHYGNIFPGIALASDSKAAGKWNTNLGGEYIAIGVGGTMTGKGADLMIIDDPHSEQEARLAQGDPTVFDSVFEWYTSGPRQRLQPGGRIVIVMCMTGDTQVLMADGTEKSLSKICVGDKVATFDNGKLTTSKVNNWRSNGIDAIYKIRTQSGKILRANERHPFLVMNEGVLEWTRLKHLKLGDLLVSLKDVIDFQNQKQNLECAELADQKQVTTKKIPMHLTDQLETMANGKACLALNVKNQQFQKVYAITATENNILRQQVLKKIEKDELKTGTELHQNSTIKWLKTAIICVIFAAKNLQAKILGRIGTQNYVSTMTTKQEKLEDCFAMTATLQSDMERQRAYLNELHRISDFTADAIVDISTDGQEEVFDVEIDRTENFIANGIVSHNTRWSDKDLTGKILRNHAGEDWEIIELPAIMPSGNPLWPEYWPLKELLSVKEEIGIYKWNAQYQQQPTGEEGAIIKRESWRRWKSDAPPPCDFIIQSWDTAFTKNERSDYSACTTWGVFSLNEDPTDKHIILLDAYRDKLEFPALKKAALEGYKEWQPDAFIVEAKAAGAPLVFELRQMGIPVQEYTPTRGNDKFVRLNSVADLFSSGKVWAPDKKWADDLIEEMARFPNAEHDDYVDSSSQALIRFRKGGFLRLPSDEEEEPQYWKRKRAYY